MVGEAFVDPAVNNSFYETLGERWIHAQDDPVALLRAEGVVKQAWVADVLRRYDVLPRAAIAPGHSYRPDGVLLRGPASAAPRTGDAPPRILDVGCGAGFLARDLRARGYEVHALDASFESLQVSRGAATPRQRNVAYARGDALRLPYRDASLDVVTCMDFLEHVEDPAACVREAARVLRPGGLFFFHTFNRNVWAWLVIIKGVEWFVRNTPAHMHVLRLFITPRELADHCRAAGLDPREWTGVRPDFRRAAFWKMLRTRVVPEDFAFVLTPSLRLSYLGVARKRA